MRSLSSLPCDASQIARLMLAKFSHTTVSTQSDPLIWTHVIGNGDTVALFERIRDPGSGTVSRTLLKVFQNSDLLVL